MEDPGATVWPMRSLVLAVVLGLTASVAVAQDWGNVAIISTTMGNHSSRLCVGDSSRPGDIGCPAYAPSLTTAGDLTVSGNVSASGLTGNTATIGALGVGSINASGDITATGRTVTAGFFVGNGAGLTNIAGASADRIVSGTTSMLAISTTGYISITQAGTNTGWFDPTRGLVTIGVSSTGPISGTNGFYSGYLGVNGAMPNSTYPLDVAGNARVQAVLFVGTTLRMSDSYGVNWPGNNDSLKGDSTTHYLALNTSGTEAMRIVSTGLVGIGTSAPSSTLHVKGPPSSTPGVGLLELQASSLDQFAWRIDSNKTLNLDQMTSGVWSNTPAFAISRNTNAMGIYTGIPSQTLHVSGTALITSWTGINFSSAANVTPTAPLEVSGTVSATRFVGNGSGLTGITTSSDRIVSGSVSAVAEQTSGTVRVSGTLAMVNTGNEVCGPATWNSIRIDPVTHFMQLCRP